MPSVFLETDRLTLRPFRNDEGEVDRVLALDNDPEVMRHINGGRPTTRDTVRTTTLPRLLRHYAGTGSRGFWAAQERDSGRFLGWFEFRPLEEHSGTVVELGYRLNRAAWGRGLATEGSLALIRKGFTELGVRKVTAGTMTVNTRSRRVMEKAGLTLLRTSHEQWPDLIEGSELGDVEYALTRADWEQRESRQSG